MKTRTLNTLAACLITTGATVAAAGLHPRVPDIAIRVGILLIVLSLPPIVAAQSRRAVVVSAEQIAAARNAGYRLGLMHAALGLLDGGGDGGATTSHARGHLRVVSSDHTERQAQ